MDRRVIGSTYNPQTWRDMESARVAPASLGASQTMTHGECTYLDILVPDDNFVRGIEIYCMNQVFGDTASIKVIDKDNVIGLGVNTILATPVSSWNITSDSQRQANYEAVIPKKIPGGTYLRISYTSIGDTNDVDLRVNLIMLKALV